MSQPLISWAFGPDVGVCRGSYAITAALSRRFVQKRGTYCEIVFLQGGIGQDDLGEVFSAIRVRC